MKDCILHNPRCSKSRQTLELLLEHGVEPLIVEYLKEPPSPAELNELCDALGVHPTEIIRSKETLFKELGLSLKDDRPREKWIAIMAGNPKLIERPIVVINGKAVIGRPPEKILTII